MKFDFVIGNPPYQAEKDDNPRKPPVYHSFMDAAYNISNIVELITPARFLFMAGQTPKAWNEKMLNDEHLKVLHYESEGERIFANTEIKGGVVITIRNTTKQYGAIKVFTPFNELNGIINKVINVSKNSFLDSIVSSRGQYRFSQEYFDDNPNATELVGSGTGNMIVSNIFDKQKEVFLESKPNNSNYIKILGRTNNRRIYKYISANYIIDNPYIRAYKVQLTEANGNGDFGEVLTSPIVAEPGEGATDTFISIGTFTSRKEADALLKYIKSKFTRAMLSIKKVTQHTPKSTWVFVPLQDFTPSSDIEWTKSIPEIDQQLYTKYGLSSEEITFIETKVKEMV